MNNSPFNWQEVGGSIQQGTIGATVDSIGAQMTFLVNWKDVAGIIAYICGYSTVNGTPGNYSLSRVPPAVHPNFQNLHATRIISVVGHGPAAQQQLGFPIFPFSPSGPPQGASPGLPLQAQPPGGPSRQLGIWKQALITVLFELPTYTILSDFNALNQPEYVRYVTKTFDTDLETLARKGVRKAFVNQALQANPRTRDFAGDSLIKVPKGRMKWTWHDVHEDWLLLGKLIPTNAFHGTGFVNLKNFPLVASPDQSVPLRDDDGNRVVPPNVQFPPGTLLLLPVKTKPRVQMQPAVLLGQVNPYFFPRTYDVEFEFIYFNPPSVDPTYVFPDAAPFTSLLVRGHNLVPSPVPIAVAGVMNQWWAAQRTTDPLFIPSSPIPSDSYLDYQYFDFEKLFKAPESL